ncbi:hypothetical protein KC327_g16156 [Hortaea werneckii]|nr:hypothetical protein KC327_g16156 [Hortaea werneckii]
MDTPRPNPTINPPPLAAVHHRRLHSRSPSHSPMRQPNPRDWDPLLRDLSPTATLRTFQTADTDSSPAFRFRGAASVSERAWGAKAAQTCLDLRIWVRELEEWKWPGSFAVPKQEPAQDEDGKGEDDGGGGGRTKNDYWGSLPASIVLGYEKRADEIAQQLDDIDVEELKDFVLSAHRQAGSGRASRDDSIASIGATTDLRRLDDFTALITATILQALPYLSRLHRLLDVWTVRLTISRNAPSYLSDLRQVQTDLEHGWAAIAVSPSTPRPRGSGANFTRGNLIEMQSMIQHQVTSLGRRLDTFLDHLEGREETVPDAWIDDFERLEKAYGDWVVQAERKALENEWRAAREREMKEAERTTTARLLAGDQLAGNASNPYDFEDHERDAELVAEPSSRPSSGLFALPTNGSQRSSMLRHSSVPFDDLAREDSETLPYKRHSRHLSQTKTLTNDSTTSHEMKATDSPSKRARHMPIIIDFDRDGHKLALMDDPMHSTGAGLASNTEGLTALPIPPPPSQGLSHVSNEHKEPDYPVDWPLASPPETERNSPVKEQQDELAFDDPDSFQPTLAHQQPQKDQDDTDDGIAGPEIQFSRAPLETDAFDRMFVSSLPASPELERPQVKKSSQDSSRGPAMDEPATHDARRINPIPTLEEAMLGDEHENLSREDLAIGSAGMPGLAADESETPMGFDRRAPLEDRSVLTKGEFAAEEADRSSSVSRDFSDAEEQDMQDNVDYFGNRPSPTVRSRAGSTSSAAEAPNVPELQPRIASPSKSPVPLKLKIPGAEAEATEQPDESPEFRPALLSRASVASIGSYPRASLRSIDVSRRSSLASPIAVAQSPRDSVPVSAIEEGPRYPSGNLLNHDSPLFFPHPPRLQDGGIPQSPVSPLSTNASPVKTRSGGLPLGTSPAERRAESRDDEESEDESPRSSRDVTPAPLNVAMAKRRAQQQNRTLVASGVSLATTPNVPERHRESTPPSSTGGDKMDRHVSEVLNRLPSSSIKFKARPGAVTPTLLRTSERRDYSGPRPRTAPRVPSRTGLNSTGGGDMTLAPAEPSTAKKSHTPSGGASEGEVKLYHLTQAGREDPIKLFVRLVGEGERVMVRVGGGWADLADYLRQYADHHGSRTVSSGSGLEMTQSALQQSSRKASSSSLTSTQLSRAPVTPDRRPGSRLGVPSTAGHAQQAPNNDAMDQAESDNHETATSFLRPSTVYERTPTMARDNTLTAQQQQQPPSRSTPQSTSSIKNSSRPSTAGSLHATSSSSRPGSSSNRPPTIGNRTPKAAGSVESLLPEQKAKWVEEMLEQARAGATGGVGGGSGGYSNSHGAEQEGEKKGTSEGYFGELGTAGATRRVVFRPSQPSSHHHLGGSGGSGKR